MQKDMGTRLAWADAYALILCKATDPNSYLSQALQRDSTKTRQQANRHEIQSIAQHMNPAFKHLFT